jgi:hypothetical protein
VTLPSALMISVPINTGGSVTVMGRSVYNNETEIIKTDGSVTVMVR